MVSNLEDAKGVDLRIQVLFEYLQINQDLFKQFDEALQPNAILTFNTKDYSIERYMKDCRVCPYS
jgi:3-hydroxyacyl-CoA dehydrogenase